MVLVLDVGVIWCATYMLPFKMLTFDKSGPSIEPSSERFFVEKNIAYTAALF